MLMWVQALILAKQLCLCPVFELNAGGESQPKSVVTQKIAVATSSLCFGVER